MLLIKFRITDYRSINDSGWVKVGKMTSLVGRNESGKSNLLLALWSLNPPGGFKDLNPIKDFPRHRRLGECTDLTEAVHTLWELDAAEQASLVKIFPRASGVTHVKVVRYYKARYLVEFGELGPLDLLPTEAASSVRKITATVEAAAEKLESAPQQQVKEVITSLSSILVAPGSPEAWAQSATPILANFRKVLASVDITLPDREDDPLNDLEGLASTITADKPAIEAARIWVIGNLPTFIYFAEYPELTGHQNIAEYLNRKVNNQTTDADENFAKMCKVAALDPQQIHTLYTENDHETRNQLANRAGAVVTSELRRLWKDRRLKVRFSPDANHLDTLISDPNTAYDVEVNLDERSRGLKWFFSFYVTFSADTAGGPADKAILLLDEPGLYLHALSQGDLIRHLAADFKNQILYTTHSPFMVPIDDLDAIRTVNIGEDTGTTVTDTPTGDSRTLFPLQMALGFSLSQSLFIGTDNLVVEGVTDFWILSAMSEYIHGLGKVGLEKALTITPAGGAQKVGYMVALLTSEGLRVIVLLDDESQARVTKDELVKSKLIRDDGVVLVTVAFPDTNRPSEADIEDLLDPDVFESLVLESYKVELKGKPLSLNARIPRIVKRFEAAFTDVGIEFHKTRPARLLLARMANKPKSIITPSTLQRMEALFQAINRQHAKAVARGSSPFK